MKKKKYFNLFHKRAKFKYKIKVYFDTLNKVHVSCHKTDLIYLYLNMKVSNKKNRYPVTNERNDGRSDMQRALQL